MSHAHSHEHSQETSEKNLWITMALNFSITLAEGIGGLISGSLSLVSDALHNFSDGVAIVVTTIALRLAKKPNTARHTFGLKRAEILAAILNASTLIVISVFLIREAIDRFRHPEAIGGILMLVVAGFGLLANVLGTLLLKKGAQHNLNLRAAYFHLLSDAVSSLAVILGALFIIFFDLYWIDPLLTVLISLYILFETFGIVREAVEIVMMTAPDGIDLEDLKNTLEALDDVCNVHHAHLWKLNDRDLHFEAHIEVADMPVSRTAQLAQRIEHQLHDRYEITHVTLQFECGACARTDLIQK